MFTPLLIAVSPIHDLMDNRIKGKSYTGSLDDNIAAEDGLGILPLSSYSIPQDQANELLVQKVLSKINKSESDKTKTVNIKDGLTSGTVGTASDLTLFNKYISASTSSSFTPVYSYSNDITLGQISNSLDVTYYIDGTNTNGQYYLAYNNKADSTNPLYIQTFNGLSGYGTSNQLSVYNNTGVHNILTYNASLFDPKSKYKIRIRNNSGTWSIDINDVNIGSVYAPTNSTDTLKAGNTCMYGNTTWDQNLKGVSSAASSSTPPPSTEVSTTNTGSLSYNSSTGVYSNFSSGNYLDIDDIPISGNPATFAIKYRATGTSGSTNAWSPSHCMFGDSLNSVYVGLGLENGLMSVSNGGSSSTLGTTRLDDGSWHTLVWTHDGTGNWQMFADGNHLGSKTGLTSGFSYQYIRQIGNGYPYSGVNYTYEISNPTIIKRQLSNTEAAAISF